MKVISGSWEELWTSPSAPKVTSSFNAVTCLEKAQNGVHPGSLPPSAEGGARAGLALPVECFDCPMIDGEPCNPYGIPGTWSKARAEAAPDQMVKKLRGYIAGGGMCASDNIANHPGGLQYCCDIIKKNASPSTQHAGCWFTTIYGLASSSSYQYLYKITTTKNGAWPTNWTQVTSKKQYIVNMQVVYPYIYGVGKQEIYKLNLTKKSPNWVSCSSLGAMQRIWVDTDGQTYGIGNNNCIWKRNTCTPSWTKIAPALKPDKPLYIQVVNSTIYVLSDGGIVYSLVKDTTVYKQVTSSQQKLQMKYMQIVDNTIYAAGKSPGEASFGAQMWTWDLNQGADDKWAILNRGDTDGPGGTIFQFHVVNNMLYALVEKGRGLWMLDITNPTVTGDWLPITPKIPIGGGGDDIKFIWAVNKQ